MSNKTAIFICENKSYLIYIREEDPSVEVDSNEKKTFAMLKNTEGQVILWFVDHHPVYETYGQDFMTQFIGYLDEPKEIITQKKVIIPNQIISYKVITSKKSTCHYRNKVIYCVDATGHPIDTPSDQTT